MTLNEYENVSDNWNTAEMLISVMSALRKDAICKTLVKSENKYWLLSAPGG